MLREKQFLILLRYSCKRIKILIYLQIRKNIREVKEENIKLERKLQKYPPKASKTRDTPCIVLLLFAQRRENFEGDFSGFVWTASPRWRGNFSGGESRRGRDVATIAMHLPDTGNKLPSHDAFTFQPTRHSPPPFFPPRYSTAFPFPLHPTLLYHPNLSFHREKIDVEKVTG